MYRIEELKTLDSTFGSPIYLFREEDFVNNYKDFVSSFCKYYSKYQLSYSYKTNYTPYIAKLVKDLGGYAEVVSDMECGVAKDIGYMPNEIVYNGPFKGELGTWCLMNGGIVNVDNLEELKGVCKLAHDNVEKKFEIGIRVNINIGQSFISRFGIDMDSKDLQKAFDMVSKVDNLEVVGLHCHVGQSRTVEAWKNRAKIMLCLADKFFSGKAPKYIDMGSGMFARMEPSLARQFGDNIPTYEDYAAAVAIPFAEHYKHLSQEEKPMLLTEPGTTIINSYIDFIGKVRAIKHIKGRDFVVLNCSKDNLGDICKMKRMPLQVVHNNEEQMMLTEAEFTGYTCLEHDVMYPDYNGMLGVGDYVVFGNVGGYSNVSKPPFIFWNSPMIAKKTDGTLKIIKKGEQFADIFATYIID
ncbi:diaminopimelate decarboxylase [Bacteroides pyogenes]|nr:diaminopimelate decarboxylase [Bacteroides pyogenes]TYK33759.1 diaminopimelate decarboxylase [Bacteroides pyogenes]